MRLHLLIILLKWGLSLGLLGGLGFGLFLIHAKMKAERDHEEGGPKTETQQKDRENLVSLEDDEAERYGLETEPARSMPWYARFSVYGRVVPNPQATAEVRSPFAGTLRASSDTSWPTLGQRVRGGQTVAWVDVRVGPEVRLDLQNKLTEAGIKQRGAEKEVSLQQDRVDSLKGVTAKQIISRVELDAALVQLAQAKNQLAMAKASVELWRKALQEIDKRTTVADFSWSQPLTAPADGEITDLSGRLGMSVEAGALVLSLVDFRRPLVRLDIPPEALALGGPPRQVEVQVPSSLPPLGGILNPTQPAESPPSAEAHLVGPAPRVDVTSQLVGYWYDVRLPRSTEDATSGILWRPGMQVTARVRAAGAAAQSAVAVPAGAVLYHEGRPLVYVRVGEEKYQRREVRLLGREGDRWIVSVRQGDLAVGLTPEEEVVSRQAQVLLSKEFLVGGADND